MRKISVLLISIVLLLLIFTVGCGKNSKNQSQKVNNPTAMQREITPDASLRRTIMEVSRIQTGTLPLTKEQKDKLIPIINDIKAQTTIEKQYADAKVLEINNILTAEQKDLLKNRQGQGNRQQPTANGQQPNSVDQNAVPPAGEKVQNGQPSQNAPGPNAAPQNGDNKGAQGVRGGAKGNNGAPQNTAQFQQVGIKDLCDKLVIELGK